MSSPDEQFDKKVAYIQQARLDRLLAWLGSTVDKEATADISYNVTKRELVVQNEHGLTDRDYVKFVVWLSQQPGISAEDAYNIETVLYSQLDTSLVRMYPEHFTRWNTIRRIKGSPPTVEKTR